MTGMTRPEDAPTVTRFAGERTFQVRPSQHTPGRWIAAETDPHRLTLQLAICDSDADAHKAVDAWIAGPPPPTGAL